MTLCAQKMICMLFLLTVLQAVAALHTAAQELHLIGEPSTVERTVHAACM